MKENFPHPENAPVIPQGQSSTIGFRLDHDARQVLAERAALLGVTPHQLARQYVLEALMKAEEGAFVRAALTAIHQEVSKVRADLIFSVQALLSGAGNLGEKEAEKWVKENFTEE